jgi:hypothetical protein
LALAEIQIEGEFGWAKKLPTWRKTIKIWKFKFEITGYHLFFFSALFFMLHFRFVFQAFSLQAELFTISAYLFITIFEDFLWFFFNPHYGLKKYNKENVYWFKTWFLGFPVFYFLVLPLAIGILITALQL